MNRKLTSQQRVFLLQSWWQTNENSARVFEMFAEKFRDTPVPTRQAIYNLNQRFQRNESVNDLPRRGRPRTSLTEENFNTVVQALFQSPKKSIRKTSAEFIIPPTGVYRIVKALKLKAYRPHLLQMLTEDDFDRRIEFCEWFSIRCEAEPDFTRRILWTDEASLKLNGRINRHNNVYWSDSNPHEVIQEELNVPGLTVWAGIWSGSIVSPYFFLWYCTWRILQGYSKRLVQK
jgi:hypothetical protein